MLAVYIKDGIHKGKYGYLFTIDARTAEVVTRNEILRVDRCLIQPLDITTSFDCMDTMVKTYKQEQGITEE